MAVAYAATSQIRLLIRPGEFGLLDFRLPANLRRAACTWLKYCCMSSMFAAAMPRSRGLEFAELKVAEHASLGQGHSSNMNTMRSIGFRASAYGLRFESYSEPVQLRQPSDVLGMFCGMDSWLWAFRFGQENWKKP